MDTPCNDPLLSLSIQDNEQVSVEDKKEYGHWQKVFTVVTPSLSIEDNEQVLVEDRKE